MSILSGEAEVQNPKIASRKTALTFIIRGLIPISFHFISSKNSNDLKTFKCYTQSAANRGV